MSSTAIGLLISGALLEFAGIVLIAWPDFVPYRNRLLLILRRGWNRLRRWVGRPATTTVHVRAATSTSVAGRVGVVTGSPPNASVEDQLAFLLRRDQETQQALIRLEHRQEDLGASVTTSIDAATEALKRETDGAVQAAITQDRPLRLLGTVLLFAGLVLSTLANLS